MSRKKKKFRHLNSEDRILINGYLNLGFSVTKIANLLKFNKSTISREISNRSNIILGSSFSCSTKDITGVCNGCRKVGICSRTKIFYDHERAHLNSITLLKDNRKKSHLSKENLKYMDDVITPMVKNGLSIHHIYYSDDNLRDICSESTIRNTIYRGELTCKCHELRKYVRYNKPKEVNELDRIYHIKKVENLIGRTFEDYKRYKKENKDLNIAQFDSVIGKRDDNKAILTITFPKYSFQFGIVIEKGVSSSVNKEMRKLFKALGDNLKDKLFPIMLSDNGSEFSSFYELEKESDNIKVFYTRPNMASDKPECERNHDLVRDLFPKGKSLNNITQEMVNEAFSNINSYCRDKLKNKTPYDALSEFINDDNFFKIIKIKRIPNKEVKLKPMI